MISFSICNIQNLHKWVMKFLTVNNTECISHYRVLNNG